MIKLDVLAVLLLPSKGAGIQLVEALARIAAHPATMHPSTTALR